MRSSHGHPHELPGICEECLRSLELRAVVREGRHGSSELATHKGSSSYDFRDVADVIS